eukprot:CAMPEP_0119321310 /NCGR_PEP_ID=MMETSP1333-20130426/55038_1 /TAXON_ID=418940 /ORGANISM="Scyphosphaera apsteinii, Strain RCC1455" /LENGTH=359 /DNA_ID=CAMNT_0007328259 /DNA_START=163 /DNA_END=1242 /DNA_ORIENTATION=-
MSLLTLIQMYSIGTERGLQPAEGDFMYLVGRTPSNQYSEYLEISHSSVLGLYEAVDNVPFMYVHNMTWDPHESQQHHKFRNTPGFTMRCETSTAAWTITVDTWNGDDEAVHSEIVARSVPKTDISSENAVQTKCSELPGREQWEVIDLHSDLHDAWMDAPDLYLMPAFEGAAQWKEQQDQDNGWLLNPIDSLGATELHHACTEGDVDYVRSLLRFRGIRDEINEEDDGGMTPLMIAAYEGHVGVVKLLFEAGAMADHDNEEGFTAFDYMQKGKSRYEVNHHLSTVTEKEYKDIKKMIMQRLRPKKRAGIGDQQSTVANFEKAAAEAQRVLEEDALKASLHGDRHYHSGKDELHSGKEEL